MGSFKSKPKSKLAGATKLEPDLKPTGLVMSGLILNLIDWGEDGLTFHGGPGRFPGGKALSILECYFQHEISVTKATDEITDMLPDMCDASRCLEISYFKSFLVNIAGQIPYNHPAQAGLVRLIMCLSNAPKLMGSKNPGPDDLRHAMDNFKSCVYEQFSPWTGDPQYPDDILHDINIAAFAARLEQTSVIFTAPTWFISTMRIVFETDFKIEEEQFREGFGEPKEISHQQNGFDGCVSMAAVWIIFAGQALYSAIVEAPVPDEGKEFERGELYHGPTLGLTRWTFWRDGFMVAAEKKASSDTARRLAYSAAKVMDVIAESMKF